MRRRVSSACRRIGRPPERPASHAGFVASTCPPEPGSPPPTSPAQYLAPPGQAAGAWTRSGVGHRSELIGNRLPLTNLADICSERFSGRRMHDQHRVRSARGCHRRRGGRARARARARGSIRDSVNWRPPKAWRTAAWRDSARRGCRQNDRSGSATATSTMWKKRQSERSGNGTAISRGRGGKTSAATGSWNARGRCVYGTDVPRASPPRRHTRPRGGSRGWHAAM